MTLTYTESAWPLIQVQILGQNCIQLNPKEPLTIWDRPRLSNADNRGKRGLAQMLKLPWG